MSRPLRIEYPGAWYHVMNRGRRSEEIFSTSRDYELFITVLKETVEMFNLKVPAYCFISNHYHLLLHTPDGNLSRCMRHINGVYTQRFNRVNKKEGQLFRGRFKAVVVNDDNYLLQVTALYPQKSDAGHEIPESHDFSLNSKMIRGFVCKSFKVGNDVLMVSKRGTENLPRDVAIYLQRKYCAQTLVELGKDYAMMNYSTVSSASERIKSRLLKDRKLQGKVSRIETKLNKGQEQT